MNSAEGDPELCTVPWTAYSLERYIVYAHGFLDSLAIWKYYID